jgi:hypothetical protein
MTATTNDPKTKAIERTPRSIASSTLLKVICGALVFFWLAASALFYVAGSYGLAASSVCAALADGSWIFANHWGRRSSYEVRLALGLATRFLNVGLLIGIIVPLAGLLLILRGPD